MYGPCCFVYIHNVHAAPHRAPPAFSHTTYTPAACRRAVYDPRRIHPYRPIRRKLTLRAHTIYAICSYTALLSKSPRRAFSAASTQYACFLLMLCCLLHFRRGGAAYFTPAVCPHRASQKAPHRAFLRRCSPIRKSGRHTRAFRSPPACAIPSFL